MKEYVVKVYDNRMETRIQTLFNQVFDDIDDLPVDKIKKFAHLIVTECVEVAEFVEKNSSPETVSSVLRRYMLNKIENHES